MNTTPHNTPLAVRHAVHGPRLGTGACAAFGLVAACCIAGRLVVPLPARDVSPHGIESLVRSRPSQLDAIRPGRITRTQVLFMLGPPERSWEDGRFFVYASDTIDAHLLFVAGGYGAGSVAVTDLGSRYSLLLEFDPTGTLKRRAVVASELRTTAADYTRVMTDFEAGRSNARR